MNVVPGNGFERTAHDPAFDRTMATRIGYCYFGRKRPPYMFLRNEPISFAHLFQGIALVKKGLRRLREDLQMGSFSETNPFSEGSFVRIVAPNATSGEKTKATDAIGHAAIRPMGVLWLSEGLLALWETLRFASAVALRAMADQGQSDSLGEKVWT